MVSQPPPPPPEDDLGALYSNGDDEQGDHPPEVGDEREDDLGDAAPDADDDHHAHAAESDDEHDDDRSGNDDPDMFAGLNHRQSLAVMALMSEPSIERAAQKAGTSERTLNRWMSQPAFQRAYRLARRQAFNQAIGLVVRYAPLAVSTLVQTMADANAPHHAKVSAASTMLKFGRDGIELDDLAARLEAIEASLNIQAPKGRLNGAATTNGWRH